MPRLKCEHQLLPLLRHYINAVKKGKHLQKNGKRLKPASIRNYSYLELLLSRFVEEKEFNLRVRIIPTNSKHFKEEKEYWKNFYLKFTSYLYDELKHHDNYVGRMIKLLRSFFNYLITEKGMNIGFFHRSFHAPSEEVEIVALTPERLNYLISADNIELAKDLLTVKDVFVFGCAVALRYSDIMRLNKSNLERINERVYLKVVSQKTNTFTKVKLPGYAVKILEKYEGKYASRILPTLDKAYMNRKIKTIMELYGFTEPIQRTRQRRGISEVVYKDSKKNSFRFCDAVTTHTMRRSAITIMLSLGMNEQMVRQISGHAANSKEFYRYIAFAQTYIDDQIDIVHQKLEQKSLKIDA